MAAAWEVESLPGEPGLDATAMLAAAAQLPATVGNVKYGLCWRCATALAVSMALPPPTAKIISASSTAESSLMRSMLASELCPPAWMKPVNSRPTPSTARTIFS